jgi:phthiocerol/phenolphthiocerol synthesis type-I polyketide synthase E
MSQPDNAVAVVGLSLRVPGAADPRAFWDNIMAGRVTLPGPLGDGTLGVGRIDRAAAFDAGLFGVTPVQAAATDPQQRVLTEVTWKALEDAGIDTQRESGRVGVFVGCGDTAYRGYVEADPALRRAVGRQQISLGNEKDFLATSLAYRLGLTGPALTVQTACSTSLVAVHLAMRSLLTYECDIAIAGGVTVQLPLEGGYAYAEGDIVSADGYCRPFTQGSRGTVPASGAGVVILRRAAETGGRARAVLLGSAVNNDGGARMNMASPSPRGQAEVIGEALEVAGREPGDIGYVETHGTGTELGDQVELSALGEVYGAAPEPCALGAVKANIGHTDTAAGVIGLIKAVLAIEHGRIPPTPGQHGDGPDMNLGARRFFLPRRPASWPEGRPRQAGVSSFGLGGTNAHVIVSEVRADGQAPASWPGHGLAVLSAATPEALGRMARSLAMTLRDDDLPLADVLGMLWHGRRHLSHRCPYPVAGADESGARRALAAALDSRTEARAAVPDPTVAILLPGQGSLPVGAGNSLRAADPEFARDLLELHDLVRRAGGPDLDGSERWAPDDPRLLDTAIVQPLLFTLELALLRALERRGVVPSVFLGHSVGELAAATWAGVFSVEAGTDAVVTRGRLMGCAATGVMTAVQAGEAVAAGLAGDLPVDICAVNGTDTVVLGGDADAITELERRCVKAVLKTTRLATAHAFHSRAMAEAGDAFALYLRGLPLGSPRATVLSNVSGEPLISAEATDPAYWGRQLRSTVRFAEGVRTLLSLDPGVVLEAGPGRVLTGLVRKAARAEGRKPVVAELLGGGAHGEPAVFLAGLGAAWSAGCAVDNLAAPPVSTVRLPGYPFAGSRHWANPAAGEPATPLLLPVTVTEAASGSSGGSSPQTGGGPGAEEETGEDVAAVLAGLWGESFGGPPVRHEDNFFELGGTSLQAAQLLSVVNDRLLLDIRLQDLYEHSTFADFVGRVEELLDMRDDEMLLELLAAMEDENDEDTLR